MNPTPPSPHLKIVPTGSLHPHEKHDFQRSLPLIERIQREAVMINPPIVAPMRDGEYVVLDGANRTQAFATLAYPHVLVQIVAYDSAYVQLETWNHVVCRWNRDSFNQLLHDAPALRLDSQAAVLPIASVHFRDADAHAIHAADESMEGRNAALNQLVSVYQRNAVLHRTALVSPADVYEQHADGIALVTFPRYHPADVIAAAAHRAYVPPGITRHIIQGRALKVNYPLLWLRDPDMSLEQKNNDLAAWLEAKLDRRQVRYYAESTYQFDE